jgi:hypothetical protein
MGAAPSSETLVTVYQIPRRHIPKKFSLHFEILVALKQFVKCESFVYVLNIVNDNHTRN